jgi:hypothetical protein
MERWTGEQHAFATKAHYMDGDRFTQAQHSFPCQYRIHHNNPVTSAHGIKTWVKNFEETDSTQSKKPPGCIRMVHTLENIVAVREATACSP